MRQLPQVWKRFYKLKFGEKFTVNNVTYQKETFLSAVRCFDPRTESYGTAAQAPLRLNFWPWTKVRTCELVRDARPGGKSSRDLGDATRMAYEAFDPAKHICFSDKHHDDNRTGPSA